MDLFYLMVIIAFFVGALLYLELCERLSRRKHD